VTSNKQIVYLTGYIVCFSLSINGITTKIMDGFLRYFCRKCNHFMLTAFFFWLVNCTVSADVEVVEEEFILQYIFACSMEIL